MGRLEEKLARVAGVGDRVTSHLEKRADEILAREPKLMSRSDQLFDAKVAILDEADGALDGVEKSLALLSNSPLPASGNSHGGEREPIEVEPDPPAVGNATGFRAA
jgi:hypothetical protein